MPWALTVPLLVVADRLGVARIGHDVYEAAASRHGGRVAPVPPVQRVVRQPGQVAGARPGRALPDGLGRVAAERGRGAPVRHPAAANAKYPAIFGVLPEAGHDQVATFDGPFAPHSTRLSAQEPGPGPDDLGDLPGWDLDYEETSRPAASPRCGWC